jgi:hypothetical protein
VARDGDGLIPLCRVVHQCGWPRIARAASGNLRIPCSLLLLLIAGCQTAGGIRSQTGAGAVETAAQQVQECRATAAGKPEYHMLRTHIPLADIDQADLGQMADVRLISPPEIVMLADWSRDIQQCRNEVVDAATRSNLAGYIPIVLADWDRQDSIVVQLVQRKIPWGEAVLRLKASRTALLAGISEETDRRGSAVTRSAEAARSNRAALLNALVRLVP